MSDPRDGNEVHAEQVATIAQAVAAARQADEQQQAQAGAWLDGGLSGTGQIITPGPRQHD